MASIGFRFTKKGFAISVRYGIEDDRSVSPDCDSSPLVCISRLCFGELHHFFTNSDGRLISWKGWPIIVFGEIHSNHLISNHPMLALLGSNSNGFGSSSRYALHVSMLMAKVRPVVSGGPVWCKERFWQGCYYRTPKTEELIPNWTYDDIFPFGLHVYTNPYQPTRCKSTPCD